MPLARYALYQKGVEMYVERFSARSSPRRPDAFRLLSYTAPTADGRPTWAPLLQTIAQEGRCFVISGELPLACSASAELIERLFLAQPTSSTGPATSPATTRQTYLAREEPRRTSGAEEEVQSSTR